MTLVRSTLMTALFVAVAAAGAFLPHGTAGDKKKAEVLEDKAGKGQESAQFTNFAKEFGLGYDSLGSLGTRIEQARKAADPVGLAVASKELAIAEKVSGKTAGITSAALLKEAVELAKLRGDSAELRAVRVLVTDKAVGKELDVAAVVAMNDEKKAAEDAKKGGRDRGIMGELHADSRVNAYITVFVDGRSIGTMRPFGDIFRFLGQTARETTFLFARADDGRTWRRNVGHATRNYHWILYP